MSRLFGWLLAIAGLLLGLGGAYAAWGELSPFAGLTGTPSERIATLVAGPGALPITELGKSDLLEACYGIVAAYYGVAQPTPKRHAILETCRSYTERTVASAPVAGLAQALAGAFAGDLGDAAGFNDGLVASQRYTPAEQWLAEFRVQLIEKHFALASPLLLEAERADLTILVHSERGIASIAKRYVDAPDFRDRVTAVVEAMSEADQGRFLGAVRKAAGLDG